MSARLKRSRAGQSQHPVQAVERSSFRRSTVAVQRVANLQNAFEHCTRATCSLERILDSSQVAEDSSPDQIVVRRALRAISLAQNWLLDCTLRELVVQTKPRLREAP